MLASAAALVIVIFGTLVLDGHRRISTGMYETQVGAQRELKLADGSTIVLNTNSEVSIDLAEHQRSVRLVRGEARFQVAKNPLRPFIVDAGAARVRAVGTAFDVRRSDERIAVTLVEGKVEVTPAQSADESPVPTFLTAGQQLSVEIGTGKQRIETVGLDQISAWLHRQLVFNATPLAAAVSEANRYLSVQITIGDPSVERMPISGVVRAGNADNFVSALESAFPVRAITAADGQITLIRRQGDKQR
jgi:transmembrane sensor